MLARAGFPGAPTGYPARAIWATTPIDLRCRERALSNRIPLLLSGYVANCWTDVGKTSPLPADRNLILVFPRTAMYRDGWHRRPTRIGTRASSRHLPNGDSSATLRSSCAQYSDVSLACFFACAVVFALLDCPVISGTAAGCAAWTTLASGTSEQSGRRTPLPAE